MVLQSVTAVPAGLPSELLERLLLLQPARRQRREFLEERLRQHFAAYKAAPDGRRATAARA